MLIELKELREATTATYRQIDYWCRVGIIETEGEPTPGSGYHRKFDENIIPKVNLLAAVSKALGNSPSPGLLKQIYENYQDGWLDLGEGVELRWNEPTQTLQSN